MQHEWNVSPRDAIEIQKKLRTEVRLKPLPHVPKTIAGVDVSLNLYEKDIYAGVLVLSYPELEVLETKVVKSQTDFPYIPGLLSFREIPALMECIEKLETKPDVYMVDGQGIAHPRRLGIASHLGVLINAPTIGCGKSRLYGEYQVPTEVGEAEDIVDPKTGEVIGVAYKSKVRSNPLIISPGHLITLEESLSIVKATLRGYRIPEPTRLAHHLANAFRKGEDVDLWKRYLLQK